MRRIELANLRPGMIIGHSLYNSLGQTLLKAGTALTASYISRLELLGVPCIYVKDPRFEIKQIKNIISDETRMNAMICVRNLLEDPNKETIVLRAEQALNSVKDIIRELLGNRLALVNLNDIRLDDDYLFGHSVNVCVLALLTGVSLNYSPSKLQELGLGALLHDVGKAVIPKAILNKPSSLSPEEYSLVRRHSEYGYQLLRDLPAAKDIAYQHHERFDGTGYPLALNGRQILEASQIVAIADVFDALTASRNYRHSYPAHEAYEYLSALGNQAFDVRLLRVFLQNIAAYPAGLAVLLSDGRRAIVLETALGDALHPRVRMFCTKEDIELRDSGIHIVRVLSPEEAAAN